MNFKKFWGGGEKMACALAQCALDAGHDVAFMVKPETPLYERLLSKEVEAHPVNYRNPLALFHSFFKTGPYDLILTQSEQEIRYAYYLALFSRTPIVTRLGVSARPRVGWIQKLLHRMTVRVNFANFSGGLEMLRDVYGTALHNPVLLPNGVDVPQRISDAPRQTLGIPEEAIVIGMVGRLEARKGCQLLLDVFQELTRRYPHLYLILAGDGGLREQLQTQAGERVLMTGHVEAVGDILRSLDIFALPVLWGEGTSNAALEAMALGIPVITTRDGGMADVVHHGEHGLIVEKGSHEALASALTQLIEDERLRGRLGTAAEIRCRKHYSMSAMARSFVHWLAVAAGQTGAMPVEERG